MTRHSHTRADGKASPPLRIAAAGDLHCKTSGAAETAAAFERTSADADVALLAGDLTMHGQVEEAAVLAEATQSFTGPVVAVLGNHDWHGGNQEEIGAVLEQAGVIVLERSWTVLEVSGSEVGVVGTKGFVGGFAGSHLPDFGEPLLRAVYAQTSADVAALEDGLRAVALCPVRIVLLHYSPTSETLEGEPPGIWTFLGSERLAAPIAEHTPDLVLHGHAHAGRMRGAVGDVPVFNVSVPVTRRDFVVFDMTASSTRPSPVH